MESLSFIMFLILYNVILCVTDRFFKSILNQCHHNSMSEGRGPNLALWKPIGNKGKINAGLLQCIVLFIFLEISN